MMRCQRLSPDALSGRKPINHQRTCKDDESFRVRSGPANPAQARQENSISHFPPTSDPLPLEAQSSGNGRDVLLQWGHGKRSRGSRAENRTTGEESTSIRVQRRAAIAGAVKIAAAAAAVTMPPSYSIGPCTPLRASTGTNNDRTIEEKASCKNRSADKPHNKSAAAEQNGFGHDTASMNHDSHNNTDPKAPSDLYQETSSGGATEKKASLEQFQWPRIYISLSRKEKDEDFLAMKGTKLPQRPKKRAKNIDRTLQYCFPGMWLSDLTKGRYEVREKKCVKKKPRGLKAMEGMNSDSE